MIAAPKYDALAGVYDRRWRRYIDSSVEAALDGLLFAGNERVLDVPIGTGELARRLLARWPALRLYGGDCSGGMLRQAQAKLPPSTALIGCDAAALPLCSESCDLVICVSSFHYFRQPAQALGEFRRVLAVGGRLLLLDWCDDYWACRLCGLWLRWVDPAFVRTYSHGACQALLEQAGFRVESSRRQRVDRLWGLMRFMATVR